MKTPYDGTVGETTKTELFEIRHLAVGKEGCDQKQVDRLPRREGYRRGLGEADQSGRGGREGRAEMTAAPFVFQERNKVRRRGATLEDRDCAEQCGAPTVARRNGDSC